MPGYKGHIAGGILFGGAALAAAGYAEVYRPDPATAGLLLAVTLLGASFPDVDTDSKGQNLFYGFLAAVDLALMIKGLYRWAAIVGFAAMLPALGRHRGWTHRWWAMLLIPLGICLLPVAFYHVEPARMLPWYAAAVVGYFSHLVLDRTF